MKIAILVPYFGKLPLSFNDWLVSAIDNKGIDFFIFTDQSIVVDLPHNISVTQLDYTEFKSLFMSKLGILGDFTPYKLCDFKVTYGFVFEEILKKYDYWGYSDIDLVYGDLNKLITRADIFGVYDKIFDLGHLSFFRNKAEINSLFLRSPEWSYIKQSKIIWVFDEFYNQQLGGINSIVEKDGYKLFNDRSMFTDILPDYIDFVERLDDGLSCCFFSFKGNVLKKHYLNRGSVVEIEQIYAHFQKRDYNKIIDRDRGVLLLPLEWDTCNSYDDAVRKLININDKSFIKNENFSRFLHKRRVNKYITLLKEVISGRCKISSIYKLLSKMLG